MSSSSWILLTALALSGVALADLPKKAPITKYTRLWTESPFTSKPPPVGPTEVANPLEDYSLAGVSPVAGGYRVTLLNKKKPDERTIVETGRPSEGFKILGVTRKAGDPLGTVVRMSSGSVTGTVAFDSKLLTLANAQGPKGAPPQPTPGVPNPMPGQQPVPGGHPMAQPGVPVQAGQPGQPGQPGQAGQQIIRQPRPRVVPPPMNTPGQQAKPSTLTRPSRHTN